MLLYFIFFTQLLFSSESCYKNNILKAIGNNFTENAGVIDFEIYNDVENILFLSDGFDHSALAEKVAIHFPQKKILRSEYDYGPQSYLQRRLPKNIITIVFDNSKNLPFQDDSVDSIVLRRGLCACNGSFFCAGVCTRKSHMKNFLLEIIRVLNKKNKSSFAVLHGYHERQDLIEIWKELIVELENKEKDIKIDIKLDDSNNFLALHLRVK